LLLWQQLTTQERADYVHGLHMALHGREHMATTPLKKIGLADGLAAIKAGMQFKAEAAPFIWGVCRKENIGASKEMIDALQKDEGEGGLQGEGAKRDEEQAPDERDDGRETNGRPSHGS
jgi:hypothetical protein